MKYQMMIDERNLIWVDLCHLFGMSPYFGAPAYPTLVEVIAYRMGVEVEDLMAANRTEEVNDVPVLQ